MLCRDWSILMLSLKLLIMYIALPLIISSQHLLFGHSLCFLFDCTGVRRLCTRASSCYTRRSRSTLRIVGKQSPFWWRNALRLSLFWFGFSLRSHFMLSCACRVFATESDFKFSLNRELADDRAKYLQLYVTLAPLLFTVHPFCCYHCCCFPLLLLLSLLSLSFVWLCLFHCVFLVLSPLQKEGGGWFDRRTLWAATKSIQRTE